MAASECGTTEESSGGEVRGNYHFLLSLEAEEKEVMEWHSYCGGQQSQLTLWKWVLYLEGLHNSLFNASCCSLMHGEE